jgi:PAS domain-containing protein
VGEQRPGEECPLARCRDTGNLVRIEEDWLVRKDGSMIPVTCTAVPFDVPGGYGIAVGFTDLSVRLAAEQAAREREIAEARAAELSAGEARHRAIPAAALDGVIIIDQRGRVTYVNAAAERISGHRADQRRTGGTWPGRLARARPACAYAPQHLHASPPVAP